jgi:hypothetical protein
MRKNIVPHDVYIDPSNVEILKDFAFVFLCVDKNSARHMIATKLEEWHVPFIDVDIDVLAIDDKQTLIGDVRITASTDKKRDHLRRRTSSADRDVELKALRNERYLPRS